MKRNKFFYLLLSLILLIVAVACEMQNPLLTESDSISYQRPKAPENLTADGGYSDRIYLSWDAVENATGYIIYGSRISEIGEGLKIIDVVRSSTPSYTFLANGRNVDRNQSYVFSVVAMTEFGGSENETLLSDYSNRIESAFAPEQINLHVLSTDTHVYAYWASPNLYSSYNSGHDYNSLYNAVFSISFTKSGDSNWTEVRPAAANTLYEAININAMRFEQGADYSFRVSMTVNHEDDSTTTVYSNTITVNIDSNFVPQVIPRESITVSDGTSYKGVYVSWIVPSHVLDLTRENTRFAIERSEDNGSNWITLVDEITDNPGINDSITASDESGSLVMTYLDTTTERGKRYVYRIKNAIVDSRGNIYTHDDADTDTSSEGSMYNPSVTSLSGTWSPVDNGISEANVTLTYTATEAITPVEDLSLKAACDRHNLISDSHEIIYSDYSDSQFTEVKPADDGYYEYSYYLVLCDSNNNIYINFGAFEFPADSTVALGNRPAVLPLFTDVSATDNRAGKIVVAFNERQYDPSLTYTYYYSIDATDDPDTIVDWTTVSNLTGNLGDVRSFEISTTDTDNKTIWLKANNGTDDYISPYSVTGSILTVDNNLSASDGTSGYEITLTWDPSDIKAGVAYSYEMTPDTPDWTSPETGVIDYSAGTYTINLANRAVAEREKTYYFRLVANNGTDSELYSNVDSGVVLPTVKNVVASKGSYIGRVKISWTPAAIAEGYRVYRYDGVGTTADSYSRVITDQDYTTETTIYDTSPSLEFPYYYVQAVHGGAESLFQETTEKNDVILFNQEVANYGYVFNSTAVSNLSVVNAGVDANNYALPYFVVRFNPTKYANIYNIFTTADEPFFSFDITQLTDPDSDNVYTNGVSATETGYVSYDKANNLVTANVTIGLVDPSDLSIKTVYVNGINTIESDNGNPPLDNARIDGTFRRALTISDYIYLYNVGLNEAVSAANTTFGGDWYGGTGTGDYEQKVYSSEGVSIGNAYANWYWQNQGNKGYIRLTDYVPSYASAIKLTTTTDIRLNHTDDGDLGYLDTDPLDMLNPVSDNFADDGNLTTISFTQENGYSSGAQQILYRKATVHVYQLKHDLSSGSYTVTVDGQSSGTTIDVTNIPDGIVVKGVIL